MNRTTQRSRMSFGAADRAFLSIVLGVGAIAVAITAVGDPLWRWINGDPIPVTYDGDATAPALDSAQLKYDFGSAQVAVPSQGATAHLASLLPGMLIAALMITGLWLIHAVARDVSTGRPFLSRNVRRLRALSALQIVGGFAVPFASSAGDIVVISQAGLTDLLQPNGFSVHISFLPLVLGLLTAVISEAFAAGSRMREDLEGVI